MGSLSPSSMLYADASTGNPTEVVGTGGAIKTTSASAAASIDSNLLITANVDAAVAAATGLRLMGYSAKESAAAPAAATGVIVIGATGAGGTPVVNLNFAASESETVWFGPDGIDAAAGISIDWLTGRFDCQIFYKIVT